MKKLNNRNIFRFPALFLLHFFIIGPFLYKLGLDINTATMASTFVSGALVMIMSHIPPVSKIFIPVNDGGSW